LAQRGYYLPHELYPAGYHANPTEPLPFASVGVQKNHVGLYLFCIYMVPDTRAWFEQAWRATGMRLDMGKSCVRVRKLEHTPLEVLGALFKRVSADEFVRSYESARSNAR
jgi:hypothetical protein